MSKKRILYAKEFNLKRFVCGEIICRSDCEVCLELVGDYIYE
jgi:hypothetical protein